MFLKYAVCNGMHCTMFAHLWNNNWSLAQVEQSRILYIFFKLIETITNLTELVLELLLLCNFVKILFIN